MPDKYSPLAAANEFIKRSGSGIDHMKLQKLVYYAQGLALSEDVDLLNEQPQVWKLGPVFNSLYYELKYHGGELITQPEKESLVGRPPMFERADKKSHDIADTVWQALKRFTAIQLSNRTHKTGTPWFLTAKKFNWSVPRNTEIPASLMRQYFINRGLTG